MIAAYVPDFDWSEIIFDLKRAGLDHLTICARLRHRITEVMVRKYMAGAQPTHWRGELILELWESVMGRSRQQAPRRIAPLSHTVRRPASIPRGSL